MTNFDRTALETLRQLLSNPAHFSSWPASLFPPAIRYLVELVQELQPLYSALGAVGQQGRVVDVEALLAGARRLQGEVLEGTQKKERASQDVGYLRRQLDIMETLLEGVLENLSPEDGNGVGKVRAALQTLLLSVRKTQLRHVGGKVMATQMQHLEELARRGGSIPAKEVLRILGVHAEEPKGPMPVDLEEARGREVLKDRMREAFPELLAYTEELEQKLLAGVAPRAQPLTDVEQVRANNRALSGRVLLLEAGLQLALAMVEKSKVLGNVAAGEPRKEGAELSALAALGAARKAFEEQVSLLFPGPGKGTPLRELVAALLHAHRPKMKEEHVRLLVDMAGQLTGE